MLKPHHPFTCRIGGLILFAAILPAACAQTTFTPPSTALHAQLGTTGAVATPGSPATDVGKQPVSGAGAGALLGAGQGAAAGLPIAAGGCGTANAFGCAVGIALGAAVAIVAAPIGAVVGAVNAHSDGDVRIADANLHAAFAESESTVTARLRDRIVSEAASLSAYKVVAYSPAPGFPKAPVAPRVDSQLEISVTALSLPVAGRINPDAKLLIAAQASFNRADGTLLYRRVWVYQGASRNYFQAAADNAQLLRSDIETGVGVLAAKIVNDMFVSSSPEVKATWPAAGTAYTVEAWTAPESALSSSPVPVASASETVPTAAGESQKVASGAVDVPFTIDYGGGSVTGVAKLENGHLIGQSSLGGRPITISGTLQDRRLELDVYGAIISPSLAQTGSGIGYYCSGNVASDRAAGSVTLPIIVSCGTESIRDTLHLELPAT